jgi:hypothetical protein
MQGQLLHERARSTAALLCAAARIRAPSLNETCASMTIVALFACFSVLYMYDALPIHINNISNFCCDKFKIKS